MENSLPIRAVEPANVKCTACAYWTPAATVGWCRRRMLEVRGERLCCNLYVNRERMTRREKK